LLYRKSRPFYVRIVNTRLHSAKRTNKNGINELFSKKVFAAAEKRHDAWAETHTDLIIPADDFLSRRTDGAVRTKNKAKPGLSYVESRQRKMKIK
jgi:hypothetical protein